MANYSFRNPDKEIEDGATITGGNFTQLVPGTEILVGKKLTITGGNWTNVKRQPEWEVTGGNWTQVEFCSHLHPNFVKHGLKECAKDCAHLVEKSEIKIDGVLIETIHEYADIYGGK